MFAGADPYGGLRDAILTALTTSHSHLAESRGDALRYPAAVAPFAAIRRQAPQATADLADLLRPGEQVYLLGNRPAGEPRLRDAGGIPCLQMVLPESRTIEPPANGAKIQQLSCSDAEAMLELIAVAYPGYFRPRTCVMGDYFGIWENGRLIAMAGERLIPEPWREISALAVHPEHAGRGLGTALLAHLVAHQRGRGGRPWLYVTATNARAIALYRHLGFETIAEVTLHRVERAGDAEPPPSRGGTSAEKDPQC